MTNPASPSSGHHPNTQPSHAQHPNGMVWPASREMQAYQQEQLHSAPITAENPFQNFQSHPSRSFQTAIPPATAPLTDPYSTYQAQQFPVFHPQAEGPLQVQQSLYSSVPPTTNDAHSSAPQHGHWFHQAPATAPSSARPHVHSVPGVSSTMCSPSTVQSGSGTRPSSFAEQQQFIVGQSSGNGPMMVRESRGAVAGVYDPAVVGPAGGQEGRASRAASRAGEVERPAEREESSDEEEDEGENGVVAYDEPRPDRRTLRPRPSITGPAAHPVEKAEDGTSDAGERDRPRKKSKRSEGTTDSTDEPVAVKANGKGNQFILTLYAYVPPAPPFPHARGPVLIPHARRMVEAPSSYPLIGWNLPGTSIVIPDSKAVRSLASHRPEKRNVC